MLEACAKTLVHEGFVTVPPHIHNIPVQLIEAASEAHQDLIRFMASLQCPTKVFRPGEKEAEVGLIHRTPKDGKDIKYFLHTAHDFRTLIKAEPELEQALDTKLKQLEIVLALYDRLTRFVLEILVEVEEQVTFTLDGKMARSFIRSCTESLPDDTTVLRGLLYPAKEKHNGAKGHPDRSFITPHLGDYGGSLHGHSSRNGGETFEISPATGEVLLFWGIKAPIVSNGKLMPLWHSATARPDEDRTAMVMFGHVKTPWQIDNAVDALQQYCRSVGQCPDEWYESFWNK